MIIRFRNCGDFPNVFMVIFVSFRYGTCNLLSASGLLRLLVEVSTRLPSQNSTLLVAPMRIAYT